MSAVKTATVEVWVLVDENGQYVASDDHDTLHERYDEIIGDDRDVTALRRVKVTLTIPLPAVLEVSGTVDEPEPAVGTLRAV